jgi:SAM-dependent methyltransferase
MDEHSVGVMGADYAMGRRRAPHLRFRLRVRAQVAIDAMRTRLPQKSARRVLDLGAAEGLTLLHARDLLGGEGQFDGVELSSALLAAAPELPPNVRLIPGDVTRLPAEIEAGSYDLCMALAILEHLDDPLACVREAARALAPGGVFVGTCPNVFWDHVAGALRLVADEHHAQRMTEQRMLEIVRDAGLDRPHFARFMLAPVGILPYLRVPVPPRLSLWIDRLVRPVPLSGLAYVNQVVVAQKPESR